MKTRLIKLKYFVLPFFIFCITNSCTNKTESFTPKERSLVHASVQQMTDAIPQNLSRNGPVAWLSYFENTPDFFMSSDGQLVFPTIDTATNIINKILLKSISKIEMHWSNMRIEPLTNKFASIAGSYHEDITDSGGKKTSHDGYFTAIAHQTPDGWKLHNAHWSGITIPK